MTSGGSTKRRVKRKGISSESFVDKKRREISPEKGAEKRFIVFKFTSIIKFCVVIALRKTVMKIRYLWAF